MRIGELSSRTGVSARALRYYEEQELLRAERTSSGQRTYLEADVERVRMIQQFFSAAVPSRTIRQLMPYIDAGHCAPDGLGLLETERGRISAAIDDLAGARDALDRLIEIANDPTPEHCPGLREPAWAPWRG